MTHIPPQSEKTFRKLEEICDWSEGELNVWEFEQSVVDLYNYYKGKLPDEQLYYACTGLVSRVGGAGVRDPIITYIELLKSGLKNKEKFIEQFKSKEEEYKKLYEDFPNILDKEHFDYCFCLLENVGFIKAYGSELKVKDMFELDLDNLIKEGEAESKTFDLYFKPEARD